MKCATGPGYPRSHPHPRIWGWIPSSSTVPTTRSVCAYINGVHLVQFAELINHWDPNSADIEILDPLDWDKKGRYTKVIEAVRQATEGNDVRVYRVPKDATRAEYWIISVSGGRAVGVKALSIES